jgi:tetratricopeptide (TPR) repeat protein
MTRISLCMIVRDEERDLPRLLASVQGVVDELCVVDTGSTDRTVSLALEAGARVESFTWCDDFAAARNASLAMATGDWVLVLDADEALEEPGARAALEAFAASSSGCGGQVTIVDRQEEGELRSRVSRFFPRRPDLRYEGRFHEQPCFGADPCPPRPLELDVAHYGYRRDAIEAKDKVARNRAFLEQLVREQPADAYLHYQLGRTHLVGGDCEEALAAFTSALDHVEPDAPYLALLSELTCHCLRRMGRSDEALTLLQQLAPAWPNRADTRYLEGLLAMDTGRLELAEGRFQQCLTLGETDGVGGSCAAMARSWGPAYHLAVLRECLGMPEDACTWYERALTLRPGHPESLAGLERLAAEQSR